MAKTAAERQKDYRKRHPEKIKENKRKYKDLEGNRRRNKRLYNKNIEVSRKKSREKNAKFRTTPWGSACYLYWNAKRRAKIDNLSFNLTKEFIYQKLLVGKCEITDLPFSFGNGRRPWMPSIDKINPSLGYTEDNVKVVVWLYNSAKAEFNHSDVIILAKAIIKKEEEGKICSY